MYWSCMKAMGFKTITISDQAYKRLQKLKGKGESFTDVIVKLSEAKGDILRHAGGWKDMSDKETDELMKSLRDMWSRWQVKRSA